MNLMESSNIRREEEEEMLIIDMLRGREGVLPPLDQKRTIPPRMAPRKAVRRLTEARAMEDE